MTAYLVRPLLVAKACGHAVIIVHYSTILVFFPAYNLPGHTKDRMLTK